MTRPRYPWRPYGKAPRCERCRRERWKGQCHNPACPSYLEGDRVRFKAGTRVVVKHYPTAVRTVACVYTDIDGGRRLDAPVDGFVSWNITELRAAPRRRR